MLIRRNAFKTPTVLRFYKALLRTHVRFRLRKFLIVLAVVGMISALPARALAADSLRVYYAGARSGVLQALKLDRDIELVADPAQAEVLVLNGAAPNTAALHARLEQGAGLVLFLGPGLTADEVSTLLGTPVTLEKKDDALSLDALDDVDDAVLKEVVWTSAPQVRERFALADAAVTPLVVGVESGKSLILGGQAVGQRHIFVFTPFLDDANPEFQSWAYFNYLIYHLTERAGGRTPDSFAGYAASPVPHAAERNLLLGLLGGLVVLSFVAFYFVRRYSLAHPEALDAVVADRADFAAHEASTDWEAIGFHRPLGGFFLALFLGLILFVPYIIYRGVILPTYILPSAQALGLWARVTEFFGVFWLFFDMGTSVAFIKFLAQYRINDPRRAVQFGQVFVWWQILSGAIQVAVAVALATTVLPRTAYAIYAWSVVIHTFIQIPGFYQVMRHALTGLQRCDYAQALDLALALVVPMLTQPVLVTAMVAWGRVNPVFGFSMGGLLGLGLAAYAAEALTFGLGLWLYRRLGYNARLYFLAHFDWSVITEAFRFGVFEMLGSTVVGVGQSMEVLLSATYLANSAEVWGNWAMAQNFVYGFNVVGALYNDLMPSISEAVSHGRRLLSQYYSVMAYKWGGLISAMLGATLLAVTDRFILGSAGPQFVRAAVYCVTLLIWGAVQYPAWVSDNVQRGANKPGLMVVMVSLEQVVRIGLMFVLLPALQINALIVAYFVGLMTKNVAGYFVNHRLCFPQRFYPWQSLVAPLLAGGAHYAVLRWLGGLIWRGPGDQIGSIVIFFVALLPAFPLFAFFYGLFGGWDDATLDEVRQAADLSTFMRPLARLFWAASALGARLSPLHGRFPIRIRQEAMAEARSLTVERVAL
jgi:O-antigen/teichoic acid export membrane protein